MTTNETMSQIEMNKAVIQRYFEAYNNKDGQSAYMGSPGIGVAGAKRDLKYSLDKLDDLNYVVEAVDTDGTSYTMTLIHDLDEKWSLFLKNWIEQGMKTTVGIIPLFDVSKNSVIVRFHIAYDS